MKRDVGIVQCTPPRTKSLTQLAITSLRMRSLSELGPLHLQARRYQEQQARNSKHRQRRSESETKMHPHTEMRLLGFNR